LKAELENEPIESGLTEEQQQLSDMLV